MCVAVLHSLLYNLHHILILQLMGLTDSLRVVLD